MVGDGEPKLDAAPEAGVGKDWVHTRKLLPRERPSRFGHLGLDQLTVDGSCPSAIVYLAANFTP